MSGEPIVANFGIALAVGAAKSNRLTETGLSAARPHVGHHTGPSTASGSGFSERCWPWTASSASCRAHLDGDAIARIMR